MSDAHSFPPSWGDDPHALLTDEEVASIVKILKSNAANWLSPKLLLLLDALIEDDKRAREMIKKYNPKL